MVNLLLANLPPVLVAQSPVSAGSASSSAASGSAALAGMLSPGAILLIAIAVTALVAFGEWMHARRVARVARLAFGPEGVPRLWARAIPVARIAAAGLLAWGLLFLAGYDPIEIDRRPAKNASKHVIICFDASPSMHIEDAGPERQKVSRAVWGGKVIQGILDRLDMETTRVTVVAFYTDAMTIVKETFDKEVIRNVFDGLPMYAAFEPGGTDVNKGVAEALEVARPWPKSSALLVVVTDGDTAGAPPPSSLPSAIANSIVIGVGDTNRSTQMWGRPSRQDSASLRQLAARLGGLYHDGNVKHLPSTVLEQLSMIQPRVGADVALRDLALFATGLGGFTLALATPLLQLFGRRRTFGSGLGAGFGSGLRFGRRPVSDPPTATPASSSRSPLSRPRPPALQTVPHTATHTTESRA